MVGDVEGSLDGAGSAGWWRLSLAPAPPQSPVTSWPSERSRWRRDADGGTVAAVPISFRWQRLNGGQWLAQPEGGLGTPPSGTPGRAACTWP